jgi:hypothetical protein
MENTTVLTIVSSILSAFTTYIFMQFKRIEDQHEAAVKLLKAGADKESTQKKLLAHTRFKDYMDTGKTYLLAQSKLMGVKVVREYSQVDRLNKEHNKLKMDVVVMVKYLVTYEFGIDTNADSYSVEFETPCIHIKCNAPSLMGTPTIAVVSQEISVPNILPNDKAKIAEMTQRMTLMAQRDGISMSRDDTVRLVYKARLMDCLREFLQRQTDVAHLPCITVDFR